jgi:hypothetical protein
MEVNAINSYEVPVHIVYDGAATGVQDIITSQAKPIKYIKDSQLIIQKDGVEYNAQGAVVK